MLSLSVLTDLQDLELVGVKVQGPPAVKFGQGYPVMRATVANKATRSAPLKAAFPGAILCQLTRLTRLVIDDLPIQDLHCVSGLSSLVVLSLCTTYKAVPLHSCVRFAPDISPGFVLSPALIDLHVGMGMVFDPAVILVQAATQQLTALRLEGARVVGPAICRSVSARAETAGEAVPVPGYFSVLASLSRLGRLELRCITGIADTSE